MSITRNPVWELSPAYEQWNAERRAHVVSVLDNFGAPGNSDWPVRAAVTEVLTPEMRPSAMHNYVRLGSQGIMRTIRYENMPDLPGVRWPNTSIFEAWFVPAIHGNTDNTKCSEWELWAYITTPYDLVVVHLGCNHTDSTIVRTANQYRRYECQTCGYTWGVDSSD